MNVIMKRNNNLKRTILRYSICASIAILVIATIIEFLHLISLSQPTVGAAIIAGTSTILVPILTLIATRQLERQKDIEQKQWEREKDIQQKQWETDKDIQQKQWEREKDIQQKQWEIEQEHRKQKIPVYEELLKFLFEVLASSNTGKPMSPQVMEESLRNFNQRLIIWGADDVLKEFSLYRRELLSHVGTNSNPNSSIEEKDVATFKLLVALEKLYYAIRVDVGHENQNLAVGDVLTLFINDVDNYVGKYKHMLS